VELTQDKIDLIGKIIKRDKKYSNNEDLFDDFFNETCKRSVAIFENLENESTIETYLRRVVTTAIINVLKDSGRLRRTRTSYVPTKEVSLESLGSVGYSEEPAVSVQKSAKSSDLESIMSESETQEWLSDGVGIEDIETAELPAETYEEMTPDSVLDRVIEDVAPVEETIDEAKVISPDYSTFNVSYLNVKIPKTPEDVAIQKEALEFVADTIKHIDQQNPEESYLQIYILRYDKGMTQSEIAQELGISQSEVSKRLFGLIDKVKKVIEN